MIGYYTDNSISQSVMKAFSRGGVKVAHIKDFDPYNIDSPIFYGILRGTGAAMRHLQYLGESFHYLDNGYFDAVYMDHKRQKEMTGKYRIVKNDMIEPMTIEPWKTAIGNMRILLIPPSPYTAFMYDTTPEDWTQEWYNKCIQFGHHPEVKNKEPGVYFTDTLDEYDAVLAFNSLAVIGAMEQGKAIFTTHGIIRNSGMLDMCAPYFDVNKVKEFYKNKQFTLEEIADRGVECLQ